MKTILVILGTRPEAIKLAPVIIELRRNSEYRVLVCNTEQQKELSNQTLSFFGIKADFNLDSMQPNQTLSGVQSRILSSLSEIYSKNKIDATIIQGDTMSVFCGALISFYNHVPIFHIEAGLRSYNLQEPFPEEALRQMVTRITDMHFAPTELAYNSLIKENISKNKIVLAGNTVIDALSCLSSEIISNATNKLTKRGIFFNDKLILVTIHRRENHGNRIDSILSAIKKLAFKYSDHQFVLPVHPNPNVKDKVFKSLGNIENIILTEPLEYPDLVCIMKHAKLILTDSGGIQEEAPTFGVPVLVLRYETERIDGVKSGFATLVGADKDKIIKEAEKILSQSKEMTRLDSKKNPYGDGKSAKRIEENIKNFYTKTDNAKKTYYIVSGGFDPLHEGHIKMIQESAKNSDGVIVLLNSDAWLRRKKGKNFQTMITRRAILDNIKGVIDVVEFNDEDNSASDGLITVRNKYPNDSLVFANGGDRKKDNIPENDICNKLNISLAFGVGGNYKANSSSWILNKWQENK